MIMKYLNHNCSAKCDYIENSCENVVWNITTQQSDERETFPALIRLSKNLLLSPDSAGPVMPEKSLDLDVENSSGDKKWQI